MRKAIIHTDGGSRGNPGLAGIGVIIYDESKNVVLELSQYIGIQTNNVAEYKALVRALELSYEMGIKDVEFYMDSELVVKQIKGEYRVKNERMKPFFEIANSLISQFDNFSIHHVRRERNKRADELANLAMDMKGISIKRKNM
ncbi:ribonuclease HI family protein [Caloranaerobacter azorensis]|uniref:Ribonuclease HI family protein n=1 Tax=Caloranaerobacter azorensis TaxID=116090 RepID=A0A6P1YBR5_9FIRM|nr:ribonuclease HI family protein [Caloranaerobacter azorensis]QIB26288.1 ribonuclease HI family protein [Caloranaerobacter azorensis]